MRLGDEAKEMTVAVEAPRAPLRGHLYARLVVMVQRLVSNSAARVFIRELDGFGAEPLDADHGHQTNSQDALHRRIGSKLFKLAHGDPMNSSSCYVAYSMTLK